MTGSRGLDAAGALCRAFDGRDVGPLAARLDDASELHVPGSSGLGGDYQGREAIIGLLQRMAAATDGTLRFEVRRSLVPHPGALRIEGWLTGTRQRRPLGATISVDVTLAGHALRSITIGCIDRSEWDAMWGRAPRCTSLNRLRTTAADRAPGLVRWTNQSAASPCHHDHHIACVAQRTDRSTKMV